MEVLFMVKMAACVLTGILSGCVSGVIVHELGHLAAGLISGYEFVSIRFFNLKAVGINKRLILKISKAPTQGQCIMRPRTSRSDPAFLISGGPAANLILGACLTVAACFQLVAGVKGQVMKEALPGCVTAGAGGINLAFGLISLMRSYAYCDGSTLKEVLRTENGKELYNCLMNIYAELEEGKTVGELDDSLFYTDLPENVRPDPLGSLAEEIAFFKERRNV